MNTMNPTSYLCYSLKKKSVALMLIFSIFFIPQVSNAKIENEKEIVSVNFLSGNKVSDMTIFGAIQFKLSPGWKTYWKSPGPLGVKPLIDWSKSSNIQDIEFFWPTPKIFHQYDTKVIGYENIVTIPIKITKKIRAKTTFLNVYLEFGVCSDICLIKTAYVHSLISDTLPHKKTSLITKAFEKLPSKITDQAFSKSKCSIEKKNGDLTVIYSLVLQKKPNSKPAMVLEYTFSDQHFENQTSEVEGKNLIIRASLNNIYKEEGIIERDRLIAILILENKGFEIVGCS